MRGGVMHGRKSHRPWKLVQNPPTQTHDRIQGGRPSQGGEDGNRNPHSLLLEGGSGEFLAPVQLHSREGKLPRRKGLVPSGSLLDQAHLSPSPGRGFCPEGEPRDNGEVIVDKPVPKLLPPTRGKGRGGRESRVSWPELQLLLQRDRGLGRLPDLRQVPKLCLVVGPAREPSLSPSSEKAMEGQGQRGPGSRTYSNSCQN